jgi:hypothetical protein
MTAPCQWTPVRKDRIEPVRELWADALRDRYGGGTPLWGPP